MPSPAHTIVVRVPLPIPHYANRSGWGMTRGAVFARSHEIKRLREVTEALVRSALIGSIGLPCAVHFVRISAGTLDSDGLVSSMKAIRDSVAKALGVDDREFRIPGVDDGRLPGSGIVVTHGQRSECRVKALNRKTGKVVSVGVQGAEITLLWGPHDHPR